ncbi:Chloroplastic group IIA intron splicing facilitator CRS1, chloroplastic [Linum grandiflorum]
MEVSGLRLLGNAGYPHHTSQMHCSRSNNILVSAVRIPTPPWLKGPLRLQPHELENLSSNSTTRTPSKHRKPADDDDDEKHKTDRALTAKEGGVRGEKTMAKIVRSIENLSAGNQQPPVDCYIFDQGGAIGGVSDVPMTKKLPWVREEKRRIVKYRMVKEKAATQAELVLDQELLEELRVEADKMRIWVKVKKLGVTQRVVDEIRSTWESNELAKVQFDVPLCRNMDRAREIVEMKTGGLVVWTWKDSLVVYRGCNYQMTKDSGLSSMVGGRKHSEDLSLFQREADRLLDGLGPRFVDWWSPKPLPVDADLLAEVVAGYRPPLRRRPVYGRPQLEDTELTHLRKVARGLPTHFVLGRNRRLQGLALAILKLWQKSHIAKIAIKWGVPNTDNEQMAFELKRLTGGVLLLRNKFFIILYRGKDYLPSEVAALVADRESEIGRFHLDEESIREKAAESVHTVEDVSIDNSNMGTLHEFRDIQNKFRMLAEGKKDSELRLEAAKENLERELRIQERKLFILDVKIEKSMRELMKLNAEWASTEDDADREILTDEERECFRKIGLKMHSCLVLGRRGIFDGVVEGLHQHWKYREVVKVITMQWTFTQVIYTAKSLEAESGGILVSVEKLNKGHAVLLYRGKNYRRPHKLHSQNLLTKREALQRSILMQRIGSLKFFAHQRRQVVSNMKSELAELEKSDKGNETSKYFKQ